MTEPKPPTLRNILDKYSPFVRGIGGAKGKALSLLVRPLEKATELVQTVLRWPHRGAENQAGQHITDCSAAVISTFARMEKKLSASFKAAADRHAALQARRQFLGLATEIKTEAAVLEKHCTILRRKFDFVTERHAFVLDQDHRGPVLLEDGVKAVEASLEPRPNPVTVRRHPLQQPQALAQ